MNKQMKMGIKVEAEHKNTIKFVENFFRKHKKFPTDKQIQASIAKDHLEEHKDYYTRLLKCKL